MRVCKDFKREVISWTTETRFVAERYCLLLLGGEIRNHSRCIGDAYREGEEGNASLRSSAFSGAVQG